MTDTPRGPRSIDAHPGDTVRYLPDRKERRLLRRHYGLPGWWLEEGGCLADVAIDEGDWAIVREATDG